MFFLATAFMTSTAGLLLATFVEALWRRWQRRFGRRT